MKKIDKKEKAETKGTTTKDITLPQNKKTTNELTNSNNVYKSTSYTTPKFMCIRPPQQLISHP